MKEIHEPGPTSSIAEFMTDPKKFLIVVGIVEEARAFLEKGMGKYDPDGALHHQEPTLGETVQDPSPAHKMVRNALLTTAIYSQGLSFIFHKMVSRGHVETLDDTATVFDETSINRSLVLLNQHYKAEIEGAKAEYPMTLSSLTSVSRVSNVRSRKRVREVISPALVAHGIWTMEDINGERANFWAGPLLTLFSDEILGKFKPLDGGDA